MGNLGSARGNRQSSLSLSCLHGSEAAVAMCGNHTLAWHRHHGHQRELRHSHLRKDRYLREARGDGEVNTDWEAEHGRVLGKIHHLESAIRVPYGPSEEATMLDATKDKAVRTPPRGAIENWIALAPTDARHTLASGGDLRSQVPLSDRSATRAAIEAGRADRVHGVIHGTSAPRGRLVHILRYVNARNILGLRQGRKQQHCGRFEPVGLCLATSLVAPTEQGSTVRPKRLFAGL